MNQNNKILVIDDDEGIRDTYVSILTPEEPSDLLSMGRELFEPETLAPKAKKKYIYDVCLAQNGSQGIARAAEAVTGESPFAVAFVDMKMPGLNGAQTARRLWDIDPDMKIVIVTAYSDYSPEDIIAVTGRDDIFYLRKPFNHEEILQFAKALTNEWNLERRRDTLERELKIANARLEQMNQNLQQKVQQQAAMIVQAEKMASVGILAAGVAHEINNPLSFINSNLAAVKTYLNRITGLYEKYKSIESYLARLDDPEAGGLLSEVSRFKADHKLQVIFDDLDVLADESIEGIDRIKNIVRDLKLFSRVDDSTFKDLNINESIETTLNMVRNQFKYKIEVNKKLGNIPHVRCYPQKISQLLMNLLINAAQAIEDTGIITIETRQVTLGRREHDRFVEIEISDDGCGIAKENMNRLFDPFFTTKPVGTGTGLGLSIVYEITKAHGGKIKVDSDVGNGTRVRVMLPAPSCKTDPNLS